MCCVVLCCAVLCCAVLCCARLVGPAGEDCQKTQKAITDLCYHEKFNADAVLMRKPIWGESTHGRTVVVPATAGKRGKRSQAMDFAEKRKDLVEHSFIPRCVCVYTSKYMYMCILRSHVRGYEWGSA